MKSIKELFSLTNIIITLIILSLPAIQVAPPIERPGQNEEVKDDNISSDVSISPDPIDPRYDLEISNQESNVQSDSQKSEVVQKSLEDLKKKLDEDPSAPQPQQSVNPDVKVDPIDGSSKDNDDKKGNIGSTLSNSKIAVIKQPDNAMSSGNPTLLKHNEPKTAVEADGHDKTLENSDDDGRKVEINGEKAATPSNIIQIKEEPAGEKTGIKPGKDALNDDKSNRGKEENTEHKDKKTQLPQDIDPKGHDPQGIAAKAQNPQDQSQDTDKKVLDIGEKAQVTQNIDPKVQLPKDSSAKVDSAAGTLNVDVKDQHPKDITVKVNSAVQTQNINAKAQLPKDSPAKADSAAETHVAVQDQLPKDITAKVDSAVDTQNIEVKAQLPKDIAAKADLATETQDKPKPLSRTENPGVKTAVDTKTEDQTKKSGDKDLNSEDKALVSEKNSEDKDTAKEPAPNPVEISKQPRTEEKAEQNPVAQPNDDNIGIDNPPAADSADKLQLVPNEDPEGSSSSALNNIDKLDSQTDSPLAPTNYDGGEDGEKADDKEGTGIDADSNSKDNDAEKMKKLESDTSLNFPEQEDNHFFAYFVTAVAVFAIGYLLIHNKQKILGLIVEGRGGRRRRRSHTYKRLDTDGSKFGQIF